MNKQLIIGLCILAIVVILYISKDKIKELMTVKIPEKLKPIIDKMVTDAKKSGVYLSVGSGLRTFDEQLAIRKKYVIDKSKVNDIEYLKNAPSNAFYPLAAKPGTSNHESGLAIDFNVTGNPKAFDWLVKNGINYGFVRTIPSEIWHWEYRPGFSMFSSVPKTDKSWMNLV